MKVELNFRTKVFLVKIRTLFRKIYYYLGHVSSKIPEALKNL